MPVLPLVASTMTDPDLSVPLFSAAKIMDKAGRSFTLPPGFTYSTLAQIVAPPWGLIRPRRTKGVLAIKLSASSATRNPLSVVRLAGLSIGSSSLAQFRRGAEGNAQWLAVHAELGLRLESRRRNTGQNSSSTRPLVD